MLWGNKRLDGLIPAHRDGADRGGVAKGKAAVETVRRFHLQHIRQDDRREKANVVYLRSEGLSNDERGK